MTARDLAGQEFNFLAPLIFVSLSASADDLDAVAADYVADATRRRCRGRGAEGGLRRPGGRRTRR